MGLGYDRRRVRTEQLIKEQRTQTLLDEVQFHIESTYFRKLVRTGKIRPCRNDQELLTSVV
jgi:hypothetical protein